MTSVEEQSPDTNSSTPESPAIQLTDPRANITTEDNQPDEDSILEDTDSNDESKDVDISTIEIASALNQQGTDDPDDLVIPEGQNEACKKIMILCSNTAQNIKKSLNQVLTNRDCSSSDESTSKLQASLNERIADFEKVVSGCLRTDSHFQITEVTEEEDSAAAGIDGSLESQDGAVSADVQESSPCADDAKLAPSDGCSKTETEAEAEFETDSSERETSPKSLEEKKVSDSATKLNEAVKDVSRNTDDKNTKKQKNGPSKKKIEKHIDLITKSLASYSSNEEKLNVLCKKHAETLEDYRLVEPRVKQLERQVMSQQREKELLQAELNRMILAKSRLEGLCREMQKQSKAIKEESLLRIREEEEKRKEIANKFQATLNDISTLMQENSKKNIQLRDENIELANKLKGLVDNYENWEQNMQKVIQQKELEAQLAKAKHAKVNLLLKTETEKFLREKQGLLEGQGELQRRCTLLTQNELRLRTELAEYTAKYEEFQGVLANSSKVFATFKTDMDTTSKKIKKLEKETNTYKQKWSSSNKALVEMIAHKEKQDKEFANAQQRIVKLEKLCRALQAERNDLQNQLSTISSSPSSPKNEEVPSAPLDSAPA